MDIALLSLEAVAQQCEEETHKYRARLNTDTRYCYELFRRALQANMQDAFTHIFRVFRPQVERWVRANRLFPITGEPVADPFISDAFLRLYRALHGEQFLRFASLESILRYLQLCTATSILSQLRYLKKSALEVDLNDELKNQHAVTPDREITSKQVWQHVNSLLPDPVDRHLVDLRFRQGLAPAEIMQQFPQEWASTREITVTLQRICRRLYKDEILRGFTGDEISSAEV